MQPTAESALRGLRLCLLERTLAVRMRRISRPWRVHRNASLALRELKEERSVGVYAIAGGEAAGHRITIADTRSEIDPAPQVAVLRCNEDKGKVLIIAQHGGRRHEDPVMLGGRP